MVRLFYVLRGIRRCQGNSWARPPRVPITVPLLKVILRFIYWSFSTYDRCLWEAVTLLAFFGLLRVSEYTAPSSRQFDSEQALCIEDVSINIHTSSLSVRLNASKTDPFRAGVTLRFSATRHFLCPVRAMIEFLRVRRATTSFLFVFADGSLLTRSRVSQLLQAVFPFSHVTTHSFRRGGASVLAQCGMPAYVIQVLGRWRSDAFMRYLSFSDRFLAAAHGRMARSDLPNS